MTTPITGKHIILGITGSIACYKAADLASKLTQAGALVDVILTAGAAQFITPLTFQSVTGRRAYTDSDLWGFEAHVLHVGLGHSTDLVVIAPATANTMAKMAGGLADNLLTVTALAARCPLLIAPAMDAGMYEHPATQANVETLRQRGAILVGPGVGRMASGLMGLGRMLEPQEIIGHIRLALAAGGPLAGRKVIVTAGGTQEPIDPVRVVANRSSGKQGFSLAQAALDLGARVTLITGPTGLETPIGASRIDTPTALQMHAAVMEEIKDADALIMAAAVADYRPSEPSPSKIKKEAGLPEIKLEPTQDILKAVAAARKEIGGLRVVVGFAAESHDLIENAQSKLKSKQLDLIVANNITAPDSGFAVDTNRVTILSAAGESESLPLMDKYEIAAVVLQRVVQILRDDQRL
jgi:phosphopantothenoylcysteine decarboxylase / phosphopantothenate---cysteine ligase